MGEPAEHAEPVVDRDDHHAAFGKLVPIVQGVEAGPDSARRHRSRRRPARFASRGGQMLSVRQSSLIGIGSGGDRCSTAAVGAGSRRGRTLSRRALLPSARAAPAAPAQRADGRLAKGIALNTRMSAIGGATHGAGGRIDYSDRGRRSGGMGDVQGGEHERRDSRRARATAANARSRSCGCFPRDEACDASDRKSGIAIT